MTQTIDEPESNSFSNVIELRAAAPIIIEKFTDAQLVGYKNDLAQQRADYLDELRRVDLVLDQEIEKRIKAAGGRALVTPDGVGFELVDEFSAWAYHAEKLRAAAELLPEDERTKVVKHVPERVEVIAAHDEPGNANSMNALVKKYGEESAFGKAMAEARERAYLGQKLKRISK
jgi:hypothetical protein